jgi:GTP-dependent phosphoenolpyruvate carboxykinase
VAKKEGKLAENMAVIAVKSLEKPDNPSYMAISLPGICG